MPFEKKKTKSKYNIDIKSAEDYKKLYEKEQNYFKEMVDDVEKLSKFCNMSMGIWWWSKSFINA